MRLLADITIPGHHFGLKAESAPGSEAFVVMTLGFLVFLFIGFGVGAYVLWRRERHPAPHRKLLMELADEASQERTTSREAKAPNPDANPWERDADWWKQ